MLHHSFAQMLIITPINVTMTRSSNNTSHHAPERTPCQVPRVQSRSRSAPVLEDLGAWWGQQVNRQVIVMARGRLSSA